MSEVAVPLYSLVALATFVLIAYLIVRFFVWLARGMAAVGFVHPDRSVRLISLAIALMLFPTFVVDVFRYFSDAALTFFYYTPRAISGSTSSVFSGCVGADDTQCFVRAWETYLQFLQDVLQNVASRLGGYGETPIQAGDLVLTAIYLLAVWVLIAQVLVMIFNVQPMSETVSKVRATVAGARPATIKNVTLFAMLGFASYLSFASIAAIPTLEREQTPEKVNDKAMADLLTRSAATFLLTLEPDAGPKLAESAFDSLRAPVGDGGVTNAKFTTDKSDAAARNTELIGLARTLKVRLKDNLATLQSVAVSTYDTSNLGRVGTRVTIDHYQAMHGWFIQEMNALEANLSNCHSAIFGFQRATIIALTGNPSSGTTVQTQAYDVSAMKQSKVSGDSFAPPAVAGSYLDAPDNSARYHDAVQACAFQYVQIAPPRRGNLQNYVGSFDVAISWLLSSESQPLVLIVGMVGFGLLGAACSTFVREVRKKEVLRTGDGALVEDLAGVVIRGVSAAVVVFLAVYGGLAIFGTNAEPNPYVVLFTCLVGAVFSETVWDWAQERLDENFKKANAGQADRENGAEEVPPAQAPEGKPAGT
jgi:hypothetical protein